MNYCLLIDWLRFTLEDREAIEDFRWRYQLDAEPIDAVGFYNSAVELRTQRGVRVGRVDWHTLHPEQKVCFTFSGRNLDEWRETEFGVMALFAFAASRRAHFTRIDVAIDVLDDDRASIAALVDSVRSGETRLKGKQHSVIQSVSRGMVGTTLYIGSRKSDKYIRVYDKAAEQGLKGKNWTRIELEAKGDYAASLGMRILSDGYGLAIAELSRAIDCPLEWWREALDAPETERVKVDRTPGKRLEWQNTVLVSMVGDAIIENAHFRAKVRELLARFDGLDNSTNIDTI